MCECMSCVCVFVCGLCSTRKKQPKNNKMKPRKEKKKPQTQFVCLLFSMHKYHLSEPQKKNCINKTLNK